MTLPKTINTATMYTLVAVVVFLVLLYLYGTRNYGYWEKRGVKHEKPIPFLGNSFPVITQRMSDTKAFSTLYDKYKNERFVGFYRATTPFLVLRDPELVKCVLATDFNNFHKRGVLPLKEFHEPIMKNLFVADGDLWKLLRQKMTPIFTSGKLKAMFPLIVEKANNLKTIAENAANSRKEIDVRDLMARFTTDFIGAVGFGVQSDSLSDENGPFRQLGRLIFKFTIREIIAVYLISMFPNLFKRLHTKSPEVGNKIVEILRSVLEQKGYKPSSRNDFIDLLIELKEKGKITGESIEETNPDGSSKQVELEMDEDLMVGQTFVFFAAGFETSSSSTSYLLHELAFHPEEQKKCQQEIDEVLSRYDNKLCYDAVLEMKYLQLAFKEGLRIWPAVGFLQRRCVAPYRIPGTDITIDKDVYVVVPVASIHNDEKNFENPDQFIPERFLPENSKHHKYAYLPFGLGPRACIGERLGLMQSLAGLAALLSEFSVEPSESTVRRVVQDPKGRTIQAVQGGIPLRIVKRNK